MQCRALPAAVALKNTVSDDDGLCGLDLQTASTYERPAVGWWRCLQAVANGKLAMSNGRSAVSNGRLAVAHGRSAVTHGRSAVGCEAWSSQRLKLLYGPNLDISSPPPPIKGLLLAGGATCKKWQMAGQQQGL